RDVRHLARGQCVADGGRDEIGGPLGLTRTNGTARPDDLVELRARFVGDDHARLGAAAVHSDDDEGHARSGVAAGAGCVYDDRMPTSSVMTVPMKTYQGHAIDANGASAGASDGKAVES